ncbi:hypothetical protein [Pedobacter aquatilis]|nr:hypothetical protein [Pedobacter aquatilis]
MLRNEASATDATDTSFLSMTEANNEVEVISGLPYKNAVELLSKSLKIKL